MKTVITCVDCATTEAVEIDDRAVLGKTKHFAELSTARGLCMECAAKRRKKN